MTAFQPELPELPAVRMRRDRFAVQGKNRRILKGKSRYAPIHRSAPHT